MMTRNLTMYEYTVEPGLPYPPYPKNRKTTVTQHIINRMEAWTLPALERGDATFHSETTMEHLPEGCGREGCGL